MTSLTMPLFSWFSAPNQAVDEVPRPAPTRRPQGPVFVTDCAVACDHSTLLLRLWQDWEDAKDNQTLD